MLKINSNYLKSAIYYSYDQAATSEINIIDFADDGPTPIAEVIENFKQLNAAVTKLTAEELLVLEVTKEEDTIAAIDSFLDHMTAHINNTPLGGYTDDSVDVYITVGGKTLALYDHAALMQSLMSALEELKDEL